MSAIKEGEGLSIENILREGKGVTKCPNAILIHNLKDFYFIRSLFSFENFCLFLIENFC